MLARELTERMYQAYRHLARTINYRARWFLDMLTREGGRATAYRLLYGKDVVYGLERLQEAGMLHWSVEAIVLNPYFDDLFTDEDRRKALDRLRLYDPDVDGKIEGWMSEDDS